MMFTLLYKPLVSIMYQTVEYLLFPFKLMVRSRFNNRIVYASIDC